MFAIELINYIYNTFIKLKQKKLFYMKPATLWEKKKRVEEDKERATICLDFEVKKRLLFTYFTFPIFSNGPKYTHPTKLEWSYNRNSKFPKKPKKSWDDNM